MSSSSSNLLILPKNVAFKDDQGNYLSVQSADGTPHLKFISGADKWDPSVWFEVNTDGETGGATIMSRIYKKYWKQDSNSNWVLADAVAADDSRTAVTAESASIFMPVKVDTNVIAFRSVANNNYCTKHSDEDTKDGFNALYPSISTGAHLTMEELVMSRKIYDPVFGQGTVYGVTPVTMATAIAVNNTDSDDNVTLKFSYTQSRTFTFTNTQSQTSGISAEISIGIPEIGFGEKISINETFTESYAWGATVQSSSTVETTFTVPVPARNSVRASMLATKGLCDVPFSYMQEDILYDGTTQHYHKTDGLFKGVNAYNFYYNADPGAVSKV